MKKFAILCLILAGCAAPEVKNESVWTVRQMQGAPAEEAGIGQGVSACYAGVHNGMLMMAGGCNFPEVPASEGGKKRFYRGIYVADASADSVFVWEKAGELQYFLNGKQIGSVDILTTEEVQRAGFVDYFQEGVEAFLL